MIFPIFEAQHFDKNNFGVALARGEYANCTFNGCDFAGGDLSGFKFLECQFADCNLSMVKLVGTVFGDVQFTNCKLIGTQFDSCNKFGFNVSYLQCNLSHASFYKLPMKKSCFRDSNLEEVDFTEADLSQATFDGCNLSRAIFEQTRLEKADFRKAIHYSINPANNKIKKAQFSLAGLPGLLADYDIFIET
jgi:Uncharacterized low-complexity proteins